MDLDYTPIDKEELRLKLDVNAVRVKISGRDHEWSAVIFSSMPMAEYEIKMLSEFGICPYVANGHFVTKSRSNDSSGVALIERFSSLDSWIQKNKEKFWVYHFSVCIGIGAHLRKFCFQLCRALQCIHKGKRFHGSVSNGVMIGTDNNVRVCNFMSREEGRRVFSESYISRPQRDDFINMINVVERIITQYGTKYPARVPSNLQWFIKMRQSSTRKVPNTFNEFRSWFKWAYNAPFFWKPARALYLYDSVNELLDSNVKRLNDARFLDQYANWMPELYNSGVFSFRKCIDTKNTKMKNS